MIFLKIVVGVLYLAVVVAPLCNIAAITAVYVLPMRKGKG